MHSISKDMRRATRDMDLGFIKYSLEDEPREGLFVHFNEQKVRPLVQKNICKKPLHKIKKVW